MATTTRQRLNFYCQVIIVLLTVIAVRLWSMPAELLPSAQGQVIDGGAVRVKLLKASQETNRLLTEIQRTLQGTLEVTVIGPERDSKKRPVPKP
jgi:hypothetical protein